MSMEYVRQQEGIKPSEAMTIRKFPTRERRTSVRSSRNFPQTYRLQPVVVEFHTDFINVRKLHERCFAFRSNSMLAVGSRCSDYHFQLTGHTQQSIR